MRPGEDRSASGVAAPGFLKYENPDMPSPPCEGTTLENKRKRPQEDTDKTPGEPSHKYRRPDAPTPPDSQVPRVSTSYGSPVHWQEYFSDWPLSITMDETLMRKRTRTPSSSYTQSVREGGSPAPWTRGHELKMQEFGICMTNYNGRATIGDECKKMCAEICDARYASPIGPLFQPNRIANLLERVQCCNEARVGRDVTPLLLPSPELLHVNETCSLPDICETLNAEWNRCDTICGPRPKPDFAVGIAGSAFDAEERSKLLLNHTSASPNFFSEHIYFPFLICEIKSSDRPLEEAERQAMHSASIAVRAIIRLHQKVGTAQELDGRILAFSVAHDTTTIQIFGHYAKIDGENLTFFRHSLYFRKIATDLLSTEAPYSAYQIVRAIYDIFFPQHLARIKLALSAMRDSEVLDSADSVPSSTGSVPPPDDAVFKKPSLPSTARLEQENDRLRQHLEEAVRLQREESDRLREEHDKQLWQQREEQREQRAAMERRVEQQREDALRQRAAMELQIKEQREEFMKQRAAMEMQVTQQREAAREDAREQRIAMERQMTDQKAMMEMQLAQQRELIALLKERVAQSHTKE